MPMRWLPERRGAGCPSSSNRRSNRFESCDCPVFRISRVTSSICRRNHEAVPVHTIDLQHARLGLANGGQVVGQGGAALVFEFRECAPRQSQGARHTLRSAAPASIARWRATGRRTRSRWRQSQTHGLFGRQVDGVAGCTRRVGRCRVTSGAYRRTTSPRTPRRSFQSWRAPRPRQSSTQSVALACPAQRPRACGRIPVHLHTQPCHFGEQAGQQLAVVQLAFARQIQAVVEALCQRGSACARAALSSFASGGSSGWFAGWFPARA